MTSPAASATFARNARAGNGSCVCVAIAAAVSRENTAQQTEKAVFIHFLHDRGVRRRRQFVPEIRVGISGCSTGNRYAHARELAFKQAWLQQPRDGGGVMHRPAFAAKPVEITAVKRIK